MAPRQTRTTQPSAAPAGAAAPTAPTAIKHRRRPDRRGRRTRRTPQPPAARSLIGRRSSGTCTSDRVSRLRGGDLEQVLEVHRLDRLAVVEDAHRHLAVGGLGVGVDVQFLAGVQHVRRHREIGLLVVALPVDQQRSVPPGLPTVILIAEASVKPRQMRTTQPSRGHRRRRPIKQRPRPRRHHVSRFVIVCPLLRPSARRSLTADRARSVKAWRSGAGMVK